MYFRFSVCKEILSILMYLNSPRRQYQFSNILERYREKNSIKNRISRRVRISKLELVNILCRKCPVLIST